VRDSDCKSEDEGSIPSLASSGVELFVMPSSHIPSECRCESCDLEDTTKSIREEFPDFKMVPKMESRFMRALHTAAKIVTFGKMDRFLAMTTTVGSTVYLTSAWDSLSKVKQEEVLLHERIHMRQMKKFGLVPFLLLYLAFPLPFLLAYFRTKFEQEAYAESMRHKAAVEGIRALERDDYREKMIQHFTSSTYGWMWCRRSDIEIWYARTVASLYLEALLKTKPL
jgi:hypothetical protein